MHDEYTLLTPENVVLQYDVAGLGSRLVAATIDYLILIVGGTILSVGIPFIGGVIASLLPSTMSGSKAALLSGFVTYGFIALTIVISFLVWWGYFVLCEVLWNGQSVGKKQQRLRVVRADGQSIDFVASLVRNLLRVVDLFLIIGVLVMLIDRNSRRLGDLAAGTIVVREPRPFGKRPNAGPGAVEPLPVAAEQAAALPNADRISAAHYAVLREFFARQGTLSPDAARSLARRLAAELAQVLDVPASDAEEPTVFLTTALRAYEAWHRYDDFS